MASAITAAGGVLSAYGDIQAGQMQANSLNAQADNLQSQANEAEAAGQYNALRQSMLASQRIGTATAAYGAAGVSSNSGSETAVLEASAANAELDRLNILHGADVRAINYENQASLNRYGAATSILGSYWKAAGAITGGAINVSQMSTGGNNLPGGSQENPMAGATPIGGEGAGMSEMAGAGEGAEMADVAAIA